MSTRLMNSQHVQREKKTPEPVSVNFCRLNAASVRLWKEPFESPCTHTRYRLQCLLSALWKICSAPDRRIMCLFHPVICHVKKHVQINLDCRGIKERWLWHYLVSFSPRWLLSAANTIRIIRRRFICKTSILSVSEGSCPLGVKSAERSWISMQKSQTGAAMVCVNVLLFFRLGDDQWAFISTYWNNLVHLNLINPLPAIVYAYIYVPISWKRCWAESDFFPVIAYMVKQHKSLDMTPQ